MTKKTEDQRILRLLEGAEDSPATERERQLEKLAYRMEKRIGELENQLGSVKSILSQQNQMLQAAPKAEEVKRISTVIEKKIHKLADEVSLLKPAEDENVLDFIREQLQKLAHVVSLEGFRHLLVGLLHGKAQIGEVDDFGYDDEYAHRVKPFFDFLYYTYWRVHVKGVEKIPDEGRALVVANHSGTLPYDGVMIRLASENEHPLRRDIRFLVEDFVYHFPFLGTFMYRTGGVRACPENATQLLQTDHVVAVFPEGIKGIGKHFKNRYRLQRFGRGGFIRLALRTGSPIIPTAVIGAEEIHPLLYRSSFLAKPLGVPYVPITPTFPWLGLLGLIPLPTRWTILFGDPIDLSQYKPEHAEDRLLVNKLSEQVRTRIQEMIFEGLAQRRSIWFG